MKNLNFATRWNAGLIDSQYAIWQKKPDCLDREWRAFFEGFELGRTSPSREPESIGQGDSVNPRKQARFTGAIYAYRSIGHTQATIDPLAKKTPDNPRLSLKRLGFEESDLGDSYDSGNYLGGKKMTLGELIGNLQKTYCGNIGVEYLHIQATNKRRWLQTRIEPSCNQHNFTGEEKMRILRKLREAELFEQFLHTHYVGQKRFSLEGGETLISCLDEIIQKSPDLGVDEIVMGMAHRGRLNVLANIVGKPYSQIFTEFEGNLNPSQAHGSGDVKYHLGATGTYIQMFGDNDIAVSLVANPSHLEAVDPVLEGIVRAKQDLTDKNLAVRPSPAPHAFACCA